MSAFWVVHPISSAWKHLTGHRNNKVGYSDLYAAQFVRRRSKGYQVEHHYLDPVI